jgi:hypothetical protein
MGMKRTQPMMKYKKPISMSIVPFSGNTIAIISFLVNHPDGRESSMFISHSSKHLPEENSR